jgi:ribose 5-phosphate isomerase B
MKIVIGADHRGFAYKEAIKENFSQQNSNISWIDVGTHSTERTDYPLYVEKLCAVLKEKKADLGILLCGSGAGMAIAANRVHGMYAAVAWNTESARVGKEDDNTNILVIPADFVSIEQAIEIIIAWLHAQFKGGRYAERLNMIK